MEKMLRAVGQTSKKQRILKPLHEFLEEQQEPFLLENYLLDRQYSSKRVYTCSNGGLAKECYEGLPKLVVQSKKPHLLNFNCLQGNDAEDSPGAWSSARCLLEMNHIQKKKRRRAFGGKSRRNYLDTLGYYSEEYHVEELNVSVKRLKFTLLEGNANEMTERESSAGLIMENVGTSVSESEDGLIQCTKFFSFKKEKKREKIKKSKESEAIVKCSLLKAILRRLTPNKRLLPILHTDLGNVSKKLSIAKTKLTCRIHKDELCSDDQTQLRICDIVSRKSFKGAQHTGNNHGSSLDKGCILSESATLPDLMEANSFCAKEAGDLLQTSNAISQEMNSKNKKMELQSVMGESNSQSLDFSPTSSSSFGSSLDSDMGSTSGEKVSSNNSFEESARDKFHPPLGIVACALETTGSSICLSLDNDEYQVKDYQPNLRNGLNQSSWATTVRDGTADSYEKLHSSNDALTQDYVLSPTPTLKSLNVLQKPEDRESPVIISKCTRDDDLRSVEMNCSSQGDEDEENVYSPDGLRQRNRDDPYHGENLEYASEIGCCVESKQLSPVSILEILFEEETSSFSPSSARTQVTEHHLLKRLTNYGQHSTKDPVTLEHKALGKEPSQTVCRNLSFWNQDNIDGVKIPNLIRVSPPLSYFQCQGEIDWEQGGADEHIKEVLNSPEILSCLTDSNKREFQDMSCSQPLKRKEMPMQAGNLLLDCVKEILEPPPRKQFDGGVLQEPWLKESFVPEQLAKVIFDQIYSWTETDTSVVENLVELAWKKEAEDWTKFWEEADEIGTEIEVDILELLIEELVVDLVCLQI